MADPVTTARAPASMGTWVRRLIEPWLAEVPLTPEEEEAFAEEWREQGLSNWGFLLLLVVACAIVWWPTDLFGYGPATQGMAAFGTARAYTIIACLAVFAALNLSTAFRRRALLLMGFMGLTVQFVWAYEMGRMGPPNEVWFIGLLPSLVIPVAVSLRRDVRILVTAAFAGVTILGYFGLHPQYWQNYMTPSLMTYALFLVTVCVLAGLHADRLRRESFLFRGRLARHAVDLLAFNEQLDRRVQEATEELRSLTQHLEIVRENERAHISRELHDELGQQLTALSLTTGVARARFEKNPASIGALLSQIDSLVTRTRTTTRNLVSNLRPQVLDDLGFAAGVDWLLRQAEAGTGARTTLSLPEPGWSPPTPLVLPVFRIIQESLTNVARHARPQTVRVEIHAEGSRVRVVIADDGVGFALDEKRVGKMGILGMRERVRALQGDFDLSSTPGKGTIIKVSFPIAAASVSP